MKWIASTPCGCLTVIDDGDIVVQYVFATETDDTVLLASEVDDDVLLAP